MSSQRSLLSLLPGRYAQVVVPAPVRGVFSYRIPDWLEPIVNPGVRVRVRFSGRTMVGVVVDILERLPDQVDAGRVRPLLDCLDSDPPVLPALLSLTRQASDRYLVGWGEMLALAVPLAGAIGSARRVRLVSGRAGEGPGDGVPLAEPLQRLLGEVERRAAGRRWLRCGDLAPSPTFPVHGACLCLVRKGLLELLDEHSGAVRGTVATVLELLERRADVLDEATRRAPVQRRVVECLLEAAGTADDPLLERTVRRHTGASAAVLRELERKGLVQRRFSRQRPAPAWTGPPQDAGSFELNRDQARALEHIESALLHPQRARPVLLHGVTGSGKTEVYLRAARTVLAQGKNVLLMVPEIGLTPQIAQRAVQVLGECVVVLHSGLSAGAREQAWWRVRGGRGRVVIGPRSAVFAPLAALGLVIVDEEQDGSYKQGERPRYNGRDVALWRARIENAVVVMGSATPSVETFGLARKRRFHIQTLPSRVLNRPLPEVQLVDMRQEWKAGRRLLSRRLEQEIQRRVAAHQQVLLLLNRRGYASTLLCRVCGSRHECPHCAVTLTLHRADATLRCHYCGYQCPRPRACIECGAEALHDLGEGTERLEALLQRRFPDARIGRFDADQTRRRGAHGRILSAFGRGDLDVLVGTQMLAKGHDFPGVTLVGVIGADAGLSMPDFRAAERTFQLLTQMAGRAGRGETAGQVVLQVHEPGHYAIAAALQHDYERFFAREIEYRRRLHYPPFVHLALCMCRGKMASDVREQAERLAGALRDTGANIQVLGPATPPISRLRNRYRMQVLIKGRQREEVARALESALERLRRRRSLPRDLVVDVDPLDLM